MSRLHAWFGVLKRQSVSFHAIFVVASLAFFLSDAPVASAALEADGKKPYQVQIVLTFGANRVFTPVFQDQLEREVAAQLKLLFGRLARIETVRTHPLLAEIEKKGLNAALDGFDGLSEWTTYFVLVDFKAGAYQVHMRSFEGLVGLAGPPTAPSQAFDRIDLAGAIARHIEASFSPVGVATPSGKEVTLQLQGGGLGLSLDRWVKPGTVFAVSRITDENGRKKASRLAWALLEVIDAPAGGSCRCRYWRRYQEDDLHPAPGTLGFRAVRLVTAPGPVRVRLIDDTTLTPLKGVHVRVQAAGAGKGTDAITDRDGLVITREDFPHLAIVQVLSDGVVRAQFPVEQAPGRVALARVKIKTDGESLAPLQTRRDAWLRRLYENGRLSAERSRELHLQLHKSLPAALAAGQKSLPLLEAEIAYLDSERDQLQRLAREKKWNLDAREGDQEIADLRRQAKALQEFITRIDGVLKATEGEQALGLFQLLERARLLEAEAEFDQAIRLYENVMQASPGEKKVRAHLDQLKADWMIRDEKHRDARSFIYQTWPALDVVGVGKNMELAREALAICRAAGDRRTPLKLMRTNAVHTANLKKQLDTLKRRDTEDNRNQARTLAQTGEALLRLHQEAAAWVGLK